MASCNDDWFHGNLSRVESEQVLRDHGFQEGLFLVRNSSTAEHCYVLSVVHNDEVIHYQIRPRDNDQLFTLSVETRVIHGLDELVYYYKKWVFTIIHMSANQRNDIQIVWFCSQPKSGLQHKLLDYVPGERCPIEARLHGTENLLHRACIAGNALVGFSNLLQYAIIIFMIPISGGTWITVLR